MWMGSQGPPVIWGKPPTQNNSPVGKASSGETKNVQGAEIPQNQTQEPKPRALEKEDVEVEIKKKIL